MGYQTDFTWNDLLIEILNMTPEERKRGVMFNDDSLMDDGKSLYGVCNMYGDIFLNTNQ